MGQKAIKEQRRFERRIMARLDVLGLKVLKILDFDEEKHFEWFALAQEVILMKPEVSLEDLYPSKIEDTYYDIVESSVRGGWEIDLDANYKRIASHDFDLEW
ncbi:hypothetical protein [Pseudobacteriovorax antillogorgiicola]|uniref:Uncharacterized protein n=1 Tax=Pseudobacteriovorax antillogorgiicola TaxID=1513793 RepID=A0A1Y6CDI9_9BACT|nr:hypothetical protein [Pseudobacteriovorax antillogorgiicola]TCS51666.1 hypothetical protein EDD56_11051 [Pseudobacteriovorax antillogorgiicola]SMF48946.1 hypothetical protein SAMN06296036_11520 [Pseudobacteriovorax antillogorgiicola]